MFNINFDPIFCRKQFTSIRHFYRKYEKPKSWQIRNQWEKPRAQSGAAGLRAVRPDDGRATQRLRLLHRGVINHTNLRMHTQV